MPCDGETIGEIMFRGNIMRRGYLFIELTPGATASEAEIIDYCKAKLARFKAPSAVVFGALPRTSTGKIQKFVLRERARAVD